jgi:FeS assembly SUF system protein
MPKPIDPDVKLNPIEKNVLLSEVKEALRQVFDPEIPVNVYDLGLIYDVDSDENRNVQIVMTLTSPACPVAESLPLEVQRAAESVPGVKSVVVELTWDPPFTLDMMSEEVKLMLGLI